MNFIKFFIAFVIIKDQSYLNDKDIFLVNHSKEMLINVVFALGIITKVIHKNLPIINLMHNMKYDKLILVENYSNLPFNACP